MWHNSESASQIPFVGDPLNPAVIIHGMGITEWCWTDYPELQPPRWSEWLEAAGWTLDHSKLSRVTNRRHSQHVKPPKIFQAIVPTGLVVVFDAGQTAVHAEPRFG